MRAPRNVSVTVGLKANDAAALPRIRLHDLRHTHATLALEAGIDVAVVAQRLGHQGTTITRDTYQHVSEAVDAEAASTIAAL